MTAVLPLPRFSLRFVVVFLGVALFPFFVAQPATAAALQTEAPAAGNNSTTSDARNSIRRTSSGSPPTVAEKVTACATSITSYCCRPGLRCRHSSCAKKTSPVAEKNEKRTTNKLHETIVASIVETGIDVKPKYIAHKLFGETRGDAIASWIVSHKWIVLGMFLVGIIFHHPLPIHALLAYVPIHAFFASVPTPALSCAPLPIHAPSHATDPTLSLYPSQFDRISFCD